jgi:hypothetical protein
MSTLGFSSDFPGSFWFSLVMRADRLLLTMLCHYATVTSDLPLDRH